MSLASLSPQSASSTHSFSAGSLTNMGRTPPENMVDPQELERRIRAVRDCTPLFEDCIDKLKADTQRYYDELIALGGRPTGPIQLYPSYKATMADGIHHYRDEYETIENIFEVDKRRASSHWGEESNKWGEELWRWQKFKESQRVQNRSELELELESADAALVEVLSKLSDWQEFEVLHERQVYHVEVAYEKCQQEHAANQNPMVAITSADTTPEVQEPYGGWTYYMGKVQKELEDPQNRLMWVKSQWTEVIAEACSSIAAAPELQEELEAKFETQANAIYRCLQQTGARPNRAVQSPDINAELPQRIQHWNSEISTFTHELWDWKIFRLWRRRVRDAEKMDQKGRKVLSQDDSCAELYTDLVQYQQQKLDRATSWVNCWRQQAREYMEARRRRLRYRPPWPAYEENDYDDDDDDMDDGEDEDEDDSDYDETEVAQAKKAGLYALHAEEKVSVAGRRLEESKQKLRDVLAESGPTSTAEYPAIQRLPTPPKSQSPESLPGSRRPSNGRGPPFSLGSNHLKEHDDEIEMSDHAEEPNQPDSEDKVMSDVEDPPNYSPPSPTVSQPRPTADTNHRKLPSPTKVHRRSKKERATNGKARMPNTNTEQHALPPFSLGPNHMKGHNDETQMLDHTEDLNPVEIKKEPNKADSENTVVSDVGDPPSHLPPSPPESQPRPTANQNHRKLPSSSPQSQTSRKTRSLIKLDQVSSGKILKKSSKNKPLKKTNDLTEQQTTAILDAVSTSCPSTEPTSLGRNAPESYTKPPSPVFPISTSRKTRSSTKLDQISSGKILKKPSKNKPLKKTKDFTDQQTAALLDIALTSSASSDPTSLGRNAPESYPKPAADTNHRALPSPSSPVSTSRKTRSSTKLDQAASGKIVKKSSKNKPLRKRKVFTEQQSMALLDAASTSYSSTGSTSSTSLGRDIPESYPKPIPDTDRRESPAPSSQTPTSSYPSTGLTSLGRNVPESYTTPTTDTDHYGQTPTSNYLSIGSTSLGRNIPESYPPPSSQTPTSSYPSTNYSSLGSNLPESYPQPIADTDQKESPAPSSQSPMSKKTRVDQLPPGKDLKKASKNKPLKNAAKVFTEASTNPAPPPPRRSERLKKKAVAASKRQV